jgi:hypothetical protein
VRAFWLCEARSNPGSHVGISCIDTLQALRVFEAAQLYRVGRMVQEIVRILQSDIDNASNFSG